MVDITTGKYPAAYALSNGWRLSQTCGGYALLAPDSTGSVRLCGVIRHHIKSFVEAFEGEPLEKLEFAIDCTFDEQTAELDEAFRQLPLCYGFSRGWKLLKAERHFK